MYPLVPSTRTHFNYKRTAQVAAPAWVEIGWVARQHAASHQTGQTSQGHATAALLYTLRHVTVLATAIAWVQHLAIASGSASFAFGQCLAPNVARQ